MRRDGSAAEVSYSPQAAGAKCHACPLRDKPKVRPTGSYTPALVLVVDGPSFHDEKRGTLAVGPAGVTLNEVLYHVGLKREDVWLTSALLCRLEVPGEKGAKAFDSKTYFAWLRKENALRRSRGEEEIPSPVECCKPRLQAELAYFEREARAAGLPNGAVVVTMGPVALKAVADKDGVLTWRGSPLPIDHFNPENAQ